MRDKKMLILFATVISCCRRAILRRKITDFVSTLSFDTFYNPIIYDRLLSFILFLLYNNTRCAFDVFISSIVASRRMREDDAPCGHTFSSSELSSRSLRHIVDYDRKDTYVPRRWDMSSPRSSALEIQIHK